MRLEGGAATAESDGRIEELVREHGRMLVRLAASRLSSVADAEDVVQDVFCTLVAKRLAFSDAEQMWMRKWLPLSARPSPRGTA